MLGDLVARHVGGHDEDGVLAVDGLPLPIRQAALQRHRVNTSSMRKCYRTLRHTRLKEMGPIFAPERIYF